MKKIILIIVTLIMTIGIVESLVAAPKSKAVITTTEFITDINCEGCVKKVMNFMPTQKGVSDVKVDLHKKIVTVSYKSSKTSDAAIIKHFSKIDIKAKVHNPKAPESGNNRR